MLLNAPAGLLEVPAGNAGEQVHSRTTATKTVFAATVRAEPAAIAGVVIPFESGVAGVTREHATRWAWPFAFA